MVEQPQTRYTKGPEGNIAYQVVGDGLSGEWKLFAPLGRNAAAIL